MLKTPSSKPTRRDAACCEVHSAARLHFGLFSTGEVNGTAFGGAGMMLDSPRIVVTSRPSSEFRITGDTADDAMSMAKRIARHFSRPLPPILLSIQNDIPRHSGLGSGTQLSLCIARVLAATWGMTCPATELAVAAARGKRSAIGTHGFSSGGLLVDGGRVDETAIAPVIERVTLPDAWRVLLIWPEGNAEGQSDQGGSCPGDSSAGDSRAGWAGVHGAKEERAFGRLDQSSAELARALRSEATQVLIPAAKCGDFDAFSDSVYSFNRMAGQCFAPVQGGVYASARIERLVQHLRKLGIRGVGQSSWGPVVFAFVENQQQAQTVKARLCDRSDHANKIVQRVMISRPRNLGHGFEGG